MAEHRDFNDELMTERCQWAFAIDRCNIPDKQIIANNKSYADIMHKMGVSALATPYIDKGTPPSPENNNKISSVNQEELNVAFELRAAADRIDRHLKKEVKGG